MWYAPVMQNPVADEPSLGLPEMQQVTQPHSQTPAVNEATCTWEGCLPPRHYNNPVYSCKVFLGGVPWNITEVCPLKTFSVFGPVRVDWPGKDAKWPHRPVPAVNKATCTWEGCLPPRHYNNPVYSCKVFLGGVPWDITEVRLLKTFSVFGPVTVDWPGKDGKRPHRPEPGYVYLQFEAEKSVKMLLEACSQQSDDNLKFFYTLSSRRFLYKRVQVIPWVISDNSFIHCPTEPPCHRNTVFVGALHGLLNAEGLAKIMEDLFGRVVYVGLNTDNNNYPTGSGTVMFRSESSYLKAVSAASVQIKTSTLMKKIKIDPYLCHSVCQICNSQPGLFFCRAQACFKYYCQTCWDLQHSLDMLSSHQPMMHF